MHLVVILCYLCEAVRTENEQNDGGLRMKSTGVVRKLDNLGRIVIPIELRKTMGIEIKDTLEIFTEGDEIILKKYQPGCIFCNDARNVKLFKGKMICEKCMKELKLND